MKRLAAALALAISSAAFAHDSGGRINGAGSPPRGDHDRDRPARTAEPAQSFRGEVKDVDSASGTVTLKHDRIDAFSVPARTAAYAVKDASLLARMKVGDRVRFNVVMQGRSLLVTNIASGD